MTARTTPSNSAPVLPTALDPRPMPLAVVSKLLRAEGEQLFMQLLARRPLSPFTPAGGPLPRLSWRRVIRRLSGPWRFRRGVPATASRATHRMARETGTFSAHTIPPAWFALVGEWAWNDLAFQVRMLHALHQTLRTDPAFCERIWWAPTDARPTRLAPEFFWLLVALALGGRGPWSPIRWLEIIVDRVRGHPVAIFGGRLNLVEQAHALTLRAGWAGFWEQWLIREFIIDAQPHVWQRSRSNLRAAVEALPLLADEGDATPRRRPEDSLAWPDWRAELPSWAQETTPEQTR